jgi:hypothetical protein
MPPLLPASQIERRSSCVTLADGMRKHCVVDNTKGLNVKHRHKLAQAQRHKPASPSRRAKVYEETDEQPRSIAGKAKKRTAHQMRAEGGKTKPRLDKFRRGGRPRNRYDNGGPAGSTAGSTRSADDPGGELATAARERKSTLGRIQDELLGPKSAYARGGRQKQRHYDDGGVIADTDVAPSPGSPSLGSGFGSALSNLGSGLATMANARGSGPPPIQVPSNAAPPANDPRFINQLYGPQAKLAARVKALEAAGQQKTMVPGKPRMPGNRQGGRVQTNRGKEK